MTQKQEGRPADLDGASRTGFLAGTNGKANPKPSKNQAYPQSPGHKGPSDTGREAAEKFTARAKPIRVRVLAVIEQGPATAEEIAAKIGEHPMIVRARCSELRGQGLIEDSGERGTGFLGGRVVRWRGTSPEERALAAARRAAETEHREGAQ